MNVIESDKCIFFDVDDTLVIWDENHATWRPHAEHVKLLKRFHARNQLIIVWSAGGHEWALKAVNELGLRNYVHTVMAKPAWWVDDLPANEVLLEVNRIYLKEKLDDDGFFT